MKEIRKIHAGALYYAVFISFIISVISGLLISYTFLYNSYIDRQAIQDQLQSNVKSGINIVLKNPKLANYTSTEEIKLYDNDYDLTAVTRKHWGVYDLLFAESKRRSHTYKNIALVGTNINKTENVALYLSDHKKYLSISGTTLIKGTCYLPKLGIKRAYIEGQGYQNKELVYGAIQQSKEQLPALYSEKIKYLEELVKLKISNADSTIELTGQNLSTGIFNSFYNKPIFVYSVKANQLTGLTISGNVILKFEHEIEIQASCNFKDVIIIAPSVIIQDGFTGSIQVFATDKIVIGEGCKLMFPSFLAVIKDKGDDLNSLLIGKSTIVAGGAMLYTTEATVKDPYIMKISETATVYGLVYCNGFIEHKGNIYGSFYCDGFTLKTPASLYENHLLNAVIDYTQIPEDFIGVNLLMQPLSEEIIKWIN